MNDKWLKGVGVAVLLFGGLMGLSGFETRMTFGKTGVTTVDSLRKDPETGLVVDDQLMLVKANCTNCHSTKLILQNRFTRDGWKQKIRWMQRTQNLWDLGQSEPKILDYLTKHYGPDAKAFNGRRQPLQSITWYKL